MELDVYKIDGTPSGEKLTLSDQIYNIEPNDHAIYLAVKSYLKNNRQGNAASKNRANVRGGGKKPWRQKGRGTARAGTSRSPVWVGGGRTFGPQPRDLSMKLPKKVKLLAKLSALTYKARDEKISIIEDFTLDAAKTREISMILKNIKLDNEKTLFVIPEYDKDKIRASSNIPNLTIRVASDLNPYDILNCSTMLLQKSTLEKIEEGCKL
ncbi:50S ribosomal protein L4 [candidate division KSB1 bacterium]|nr:50S ribosomal protein L4 [candidate division KSB1 bacterium]